MAQRSVGVFRQIFDAAKFKIKPIPPGKKTGVGYHAFARFFLIL